MHVNPGTMVVVLALTRGSVYAVEALGDLEEAEMGGPALGSALEGLTSSAWREIAEISGRTADELYNPLCFIENDVTDTQVTFCDHSIRQAGQPGRRQNIHFGYQTCCRLAEVSECTTVETCSLLCFIKGGIQTHMLVL